jgi:hypothetical protein
VHKESSFWRSWFGFGSSSYDSESDSDDDNKQKAKNVLKSNENNSTRPHGPKMMSQATRKSSAERITNFNAPTEEERETIKAAKHSRPRIRHIR